MDYLATRRESILTAIVDKKQIDDAITADLKSALTEFKSTYQA
jgi:hypothetical protein